MKKVFAFDMGKASIGYCVREGLDIKALGSIIIAKDHGENLSNKIRRSAYKTLQAHKSREEFFNKFWVACGLDPLKSDDILFKKEFAKKNDKTIYNSTLLKIALLQGKQLEVWQIYKALFNAIQRRGYDANLPWARNSEKSDDDKKNEEYLLRYSNDEEGNPLIFSEEYKYPCYYDAKRLCLWDENNPNKLGIFVPLKGITKVRDTGLVAPRYLVEKELTQLYLNAQKQLFQLQDYSVEYFLYGEYKESYGSYNNLEFKKFRGTMNDWQGVLGQKIPRFDNRIISKCRLLPKRNVCKANTLENVSFVLLMKLKNLRLTDNFGEKVILTPEAINKIYKYWRTDKAKIGTDKENLEATITKTDIKKVLDLKVEMESMKANISGRSSFCRRACKIMIKIITEGVENPATMDVAEFIDNVDTKNGVAEEELRKMLKTIGTWENLYIPDNRDEMAQMASDDREKTDIIIGCLTNPIVRNRLQLVRDLLLNLKQKYGTPDEVIFEFIRDGADNSLFGTKKQIKP